MLRSTDVGVLGFEEQVRLFALIDGCRNRFGRFDSQAGGRKVRARMFTAVERSTAASWRSVEAIYIAWSPSPMSFGLAVETFTGFDPAVDSSPTREQMFAALQAVSG